MDRFVAIDTCPLCGGGQALPHSTPRPNLYSEMLADLTGLDERDLLERMGNDACTDCGLIRKRRWLSRDLLSRLFTERVPSHPRGWDVLSGRFTPDNFQREVEAFGRACDAHDQGQINRYRRALTSIVDSIPALAGTGESKALLRAIEEGDIDGLRAADPLLRRSMGEPAAFKRFSGFSASSLWDYVESRLGTIRSYAEVGCPLWGLLPRAKERGCRAVHLARVEPNYWSDGCRRDGVHCRDHLVASTGVAAADWQDDPATPYDAIGVFQYLDHLERPGDFMAELFRRSRAAVVILDAVDEPVAAQHFSGWTTRSVEWLADRHGCTVHADFDAIRPSGNSLFLLARDGARAPS